MEYFFKRSLEWLLGKTPPTGPVYHTFRYSANMTPDIIAMNMNRVRRLNAAAVETYEQEVMQKKQQEQLARLKAATEAHAIALEEGARMQAIALEEKVRIQTATLETAHKQTQRAEKKERRRQTYQTLYQAIISTPYQAYQATKKQTKQVYQTKEKQIRDTGRSFQHRFTQLTNTLTNRLRPQQPTIPIDKEIIEIIDNADYKNNGYTTQNHTSQGISVYSSVTLSTRTYANGVEFYVLRKNANNLAPEEHEIILGMTEKSKKHAHNKNYSRITKQQAQACAEKSLNQRKHWKHKKKQQRQEERIAA